MNLASLFGTPTAPEPSLCDNCQHAYEMPGGAVSYGGKTFVQRYCGKLTIGIHGDGKQDCEHHLVRTIPS